MNNSPSSLYDQPILEESISSHSSQESSSSIESGRNIIRGNYNDKLSKDGWFTKNTVHKPKIYEKIKNEYLLTSRLSRETAYYTNNFMRLQRLKDKIIQNNPHMYDIDFKYFINNPYTKNDYEKCAYYLHFLIIYSTPKDVDVFLKHYYNDYCIDSNKKETLQSQNSMRMFINFPLICHFNKNIITPLMCAMLWSNEPEMIRILYCWGADLSVTDVHNNYCENIYNTHAYYYNHLHPFVVSNHIVLGVRDIRDFELVKQEVRYLSGEHSPPPDSKWYLPKKYI